jgi:CheY-like chemotaxis protein
MTEIAAKVYSAGCGAAKMSGEIRQALIVDDEQSVRTQLSRALEAKGFACEMAADGAEALTRFHSVQH